VSIQRLYDDLGLTPIDLVAVVMETEQVELGSDEFPVETLRDVRTVGDLVNAIEDWCAQRDTYETIDFGELEEPSRADHERRSSDGFSEHESLDEGRDDRVDRAAKWLEIEIRLPRLLENDALDQGDQDSREGVVVDVAMPTVAPAANEREREPALTDAFVHDRAVQTPIVQRFRPNLDSAAGSAR